MGREGQGLEGSCNRGALDSFFPNFERFQGFSQNDKVVAFSGAAPFQKNNEKKVRVVHHIAAT